MSWNEVAKIIEKEYGGYVDWDEGFFICPECDEPIYEEDFPYFENAFCPVCEFEF